MRAISQGRGGFSVEGMMVAGRKAAETRTAKAGRDPVTEQGQRHRESQSLTRDRGREKCRWRQSESASSCRLLLRRLGALADAKEDGPRQASVGVGRKAQAVNVDTC